MENVAETEHSLYDILDFVCVCVCMCVYVCVCVIMFVNIWALEKASDV